MKKITTLLFMSILLHISMVGQEVIPFDTTHWDINANAYMIENFKGKNAIYLQGGRAVLKDTKFLNGTIEFDIYLTERRGFPGILFRILDQDAESFYFRPHQSGNPDANQAAPIINGSTAWQFYHGPSYSTPYKYKLDIWTHVRLVIKDSQAQIYLNHSDGPILSWRLVHPPRAGGLAIGGGGGAFHYANFKIRKDVGEIKDFNVAKRQPIDGLIPSWKISDKFDESLLSTPEKISQLIQARKWTKTIQIEEGTAANIERVVNLRSTPGNTVFAKITIQSDSDQTKLFEFGYSDRVVAVLNGNAIYKGNNRFQSRDYRYLGTIGLFDAIYLDLKKGENTLLFAVSEDFGGWLITGRFEDMKGITIK